MPQPPPPKDSSSIIKLAQVAVKSNLARHLFHNILTQHDESSFNDIISTQLLADELVIYEWIKKFYRQYKTLPSVATLKSNGHVLMEVEGDAPTDPTPYLFTRIRDRAIFNAANNKSEAIANAMLNQNAAELTSLFRGVVADIAALENPKAYTTLAHLVIQVGNEYEIAKDTPGLMGITTGYPTLDANTSGLMPGDYVVVVARPGMGKTYFLANMARACWRGGDRPAILTMEMINIGLARRWMGVDAKLNPDLIRRGQLDCYGEAILQQTITDYQSMHPVHFMSGNFRKNTTAVEEMIIQLNPSAVYLDASYLITPSKSGSYESTTDRQKKVNDELKQLAIDYNLPIVVTVQFNRNRKKFERSANKSGGSRFDVGEIGGTDAVGQNADIILGMRIPPSPFQKTHRIIEGMKFRESGEVDFATEFSFWPMGFDEVPLHTIIGDEDDDDDDDEENDDGPESGKKHKEKPQKPDWIMK